MSYGDDFNDLLSDSKRQAELEVSDGVPRDSDLLLEFENKLFGYERERENNRPALTDEELYERWKEYAAMKDADQGMFYMPSRTMELFHQNMKMFRFVMGPVGCLSGDCKIYADGELKTIRELYESGKPFKCLSLRDDGSVGWEEATAPFVKGSEKLIRMYLNNGAMLRVARSHLILTKSGGWRKCGESLKGYRLKVIERFETFTSVWRYHPERRILSQEEEPEEDIYYDLTVESTGNYIGEYGLIHHNSGKTTGIVADIQMRCLTQNPCADGIIRNRGAFIRGTHRELRETLVETWMQMFPHTKVRLSHPLRGEYTCLNGDGTKSVTEFLGYGMDKAGAESDLRSNAYSFGVMNECQYLGWHIVSLLRERVGRYPNKTMAPVNWREMDGKWWYEGNEHIPSEWRWFKNLGVNGDTNAPPEDHWWVYRAEKEPIPDLMEFFRQPPAMFRTFDEETEKFVYVPNKGQRNGIFPAENIKNLPEGWQYYFDLVRMSGDDYAARNVLNEYAPTAVGTPVFSEFNKRWHVPKGGVSKPPSGTRVFAGMDFGRTPRVVLAWIDTRGRICCFSEVKRDCGVQMFAERELLPHVTALGISPWNVRIFCDPAGGLLGEQSERTSIEIMRQAGFDAVAPVLINNSESMRLETVRQFLTRIVGETGGIVFDRSGCPDSILAMNGGYVWGRRKLHGEYQDLDKPDKRSIHSHIADAIQYLCVGIKYGGTEPNSEIIKPSYTEIIAYGSGGIHGSGINHQNNEGFVC